jgi:hypothetical protein
LKQVSRLSAKEVNGVQGRIELISELEGLRWLVVVDLVARRRELVERMDAPSLPLRSIAPVIISATLFNGKIEKRATCLVVISQELIQKINSFVTDKSLILRIDEAVPVFLGESSENIVILSIELNFILVEVVKKIFSA